MINKGKKRKETLEILDAVFENSEDVLNSLLEGLSRMLETDKNNFIKNIKILSQKETSLNPHLLVVGEDITEEQASEIIIRTNRWPIIRFSHLYEKIKKIYISSLPEEELISHVEFNYQILEKKIKSLHLNYFFNNRVDSTSGLRGWCNWDGKIFCNNYVLRGWPNYENIISDLEAISSNFPYLKFKLQIVEKQKTFKLAYTFQIKDGKVKELYSKKLITKPDDTVLNEDYPENTESYEKHINKVLDGIKKLIF
jgi:hypothetical protein